MDASKFTQLCSFDIRQDLNADFNLISNSDNNTFLIFGSNTEATIFELLNGIIISNTFPFSISYVKTLETSPLLKLTDEITLYPIYAQCNVQESQELGLEPVYLGESRLSIPETKRGKFIHAEWAPHKLNKNDVLTTLSSHGLCQLWIKDAITREWQQIYNLTSNLLSSVNKSNISENIQTFQDLKDFVDFHWITAFCWDNNKEGNIIYTGNAVGHIRVFILSEDFEDVQEYCQVETDVKRIQSIKSFADFLLISGVNGQMQLCRIIHGKMPVIELEERLWNKADRLPFHNVEITFSRDLNSYFVIVSKAAFLLVFRLSIEGRLISKCTTPIKGAIKITGLIAFNETSFIVTTMTNCVRRIELFCTDDESFEIIERNVDLYISNMQIVGVATTRNRLLWSFLLKRSVELLNDFVQGNHVNNTTIISVCCFNNTLNLLTLANERIEAMDSYKDCVIQLQLDIEKTFDNNKYDNFNHEIYEEFKYGFNDMLLQKLQIKLLVTRTLLMTHNYKYKDSANRMVFEMSFLTICVQIVHILCRAQYLQNIYGDYNNLNDFQKLSVKCMMNQLMVLIAELKELQNKLNTFNNIIESFTQFVLETVATQNLSVAYDGDEEKCIECKEVVNIQTMICYNGHKVRRCCVSYIQVDLFDNQFCPRCNSLALADNMLLQQIFSNDELVKCTFCRFKFQKNDD